LKSQPSVGGAKLSKIVGVSYNCCEGAAVEVHTVRQAMIVGLAVVLSAGSGFAGNQSSDFGQKGLDELTKS